MTEVVSIIGDSNVNRHLDTAKSANPHLHCLRQSHLIPAFNAMQLETALTSKNEHRKVVVVAALTNMITYTAFLGGGQLIQNAKIFFQQVISWIQQGRSFDDGTNHTVLILPLHLCSGVFWRGVQSSRTPNPDFTVVSRPWVRGGWLPLYLYIRASLCSALG